MTAALIIIVAAIVLIGGTWLLLWWDERRDRRRVRRRDPFAHVPVPGDGQSFGDMPPEIAHEEYLPAQLAACPAVRPPTDLVPGAGTRTPPVTTAAWPSAAYTLKADSPAPASTLAPAAPDATPNSGPAAGARAPDVPGQETRTLRHGAGANPPPAGDSGTPHSASAAEVSAPEEAPGPAGAPEGDGPRARPPQGTTGPGDLLAKAAAGIKALPVSDYLTEAAAASAWEDRAPLAALLSDDTMTRAGFPPIKEEVA